MRDSSAWQRGNLWFFISTRVSYTKSAFVIRKHIASVIPYHAPPLPTLRPCICNKQSHFQEDWDFNFLHTDDILVTPDPPPRSLLITLTRSLMVVKGGDEGVPDEGETGPPHSFPPIPLTLPPDVSHLPFPLFQEREFCTVQPGQSQWSRVLHSECTAEEKWILISTSCRE